MKSTPFKNDSILDQVYLGALPAHIPTLLASAVTWQLITMLSPLFFSRVKTYRNLSTEDKSHWNIRVTHIIHAFTISMLALMILKDKDLAADPLYGQSWLSGQIYAIACGYFLWDTLVSLMQLRTISIVVHGVACFFVYLFAFGPFATYYGAVFLLFEISTPFLNINWFLDKMKLTGSTYQGVNGVLLILSFFFARIVYGFYASVRFFGSVYEHRDVTPTFHIVLYGVANVVLNSLNVLWFTKIISGFIKRMLPSKQSKGGKKTK